MNNWVNDKTLGLADALVRINDRKTALNFLRDLLTIKEIQTIENRWRAAQMLHDGMSYTQIENETGLSSATIAIVQKYLQYGEGGYKALLEKHNSLSQSTLKD